MTRRKCLVRSGLLLLVVCLGSTQWACGPSPQLSLRINELMAKTKAGNDWIEIYNPTDQELSLAGLQLTDSNSGKVWDFPTDAKIGAKGFVQVFCDDTDTGLHTNFKLSSGGETITLRTVVAEEIDKVTYPEQKEDISWGRSPDGSGSWKAQSTASPGKTNAN